MSETIGASEHAEDERSGGQRPLTTDERALLERLLSDPFAYPMPFKTWLISFLEGSDLLLPRSSVQGLGSALGTGGGSGLLGVLPAGIIFPYGGAAAPTGALLCNGAAVSRTQYKRLFEAIGAIYGGGDGSSTFNVPDLRRRLPFGAGAGFGHGASDGQPEASRHIDHHHYFQDTSAVDVAGGTDSVGDHNHGMPGRTGQTFNIRSAATGVQVPYLEPVGDPWTGNAGGHSHGVSASGSAYVSGDTSGGYDEDHPSFLAVGFIINY